MLKLPCKRLKDKKHLLLLLLALLKFVDFKYLDKRVVAFLCLVNFNKGWIELEHWMTWQLLLKEADWSLQLSFEISMFFTRHLLPTGVVIWNNPNTYTQKILNRNSKILSLAIWFLKMQINLENQENVSKHRNSKRITYILVDSSAPTPCVLM